LYGQSEVGSGPFAVRSVRSFGFAGRSIDRLLASLVRAHPNDAEAACRKQSKHQPESALT
jgi:hypothetical protein